MRVCRSNTGDCGSSAVAAPLRQIRVQAGVPVPPLRVGNRSALRNRNLPWPYMQPGDSFFIAAADWQEPVSAERVLAQAMRTRKLNHGEAYTMRTRRIDRDGEEGWRIWRIA